MVAEAINQDQVVEAVREVLATSMAPVAEEVMRLERLRRKQSLTTDEVAELYGYSAGTLRNWRCKGRGPAYTRDGGVIVYRRKDVEAYQEAHRVRTYDQQA